MAAQLRRGNVDEEKIQAVVDRRFPQKIERATLRAENLEIVALWLRVCNRWIHTPTGMGSIKTGLDWWYVMNVALLEVPRIHYAPHWKRKKRVKWFVKGLQAMEMAALSVFMDEERKQQRKAKQKTRSRGR